MEYRKRDALRKSRIFLLENVIFDELVDHVIDQDIFSDNMLEYIKAGRERVEQIRRLLDYLGKRPDVCFERFLNALRNSHQEHCAIHILEKYVEGEPTQVSDLTPVVNIDLAPRTPKDYDPMDISSVQDPNSLPLVSSNCSTMANVSSSSGQEAGFPEMLTSVNTLCISCDRSPVQESSPGGGLPMPGTLPCSGLQSVHAAKSMQQSAVGPTGDNQNVSAYERHFQSNPLHVYKMETNPRGYALVINNEQFKSMSERTGSRKDMENLHDLFKLLGFDMCHYVDKTAEEMKVLLKTFAQFEALKKVDSLAVLILSHGGRDGIIYGCDGSATGGSTRSYITDEEIRDIFSAKNCPVMADKPKLFIIQACRGRNEDVPEAGRIDRNGADRMVHDGTSLNSNASSTSSRSANMADMCLIHSTVQGYVSYRHPIDGSPFIQVFTDVLKQQATHEHLMDMMLKVNGKLSSLALQSDLRTIPDTTNTLTRKWFLNPLHLSP